VLFHGFVERVETLATGQQYSYSYSTRQQPTALVIVVSRRFCTILHF